MFLPNVSSIIWFVNLRNLALCNHSPGTISFSFFLSFFEKLWENWESLLCHLKVKVKVKVKFTQLCPTLCDPMYYSPPGSSVHGILQARILEWVAISFSRGSSQPRNQTQVSHIAGRRFNLWATREAHQVLWPVLIELPLCHWVVNSSLSILDNGSLSDKWFLSVSLNSLDCLLTFLIVFFDAQNF